MIKLKSLLEATKIRGANNKMVEVPKSYNDKTGKFAYRFYRTPGMGGDLTSGWAYQFGDLCPLDGMQVPFWWNRLMEDPGFLVALEERWTFLRSNILSNENILDLIDELSLEITDSGAVDRNFGKWLVLGKYIWPNNFIGNRHSEEIDYLKEWVIERLSWIDQQIITT